MADNAVHDLTPAYALDALDEIERLEYEAHLATCEDCRDELASTRRPHRHRRHSCAGGSSSRRGASGT